MNTKIKKIGTIFMALGFLSIATYTPIAYHSISSAFASSTLSNEGGTIKLKQSVKVTYIKMYAQPYKNHAIGTTTLPKGTIVRGFFKGTEGPNWVIYGGHVKITKTVWPSANLNSKNAQIIHKYDCYSYTMNKLG